MMSCNIYIVDDDEAVRTSLACLLSTMDDCVTHTYASGDEFLEVAHELEPGCVLLDLRMPGTLGINILESLSSMKETFKVIILTGDGEVGLAVQAMKLGAVDFMEKPYNPIRLMQAIEAAFISLAHSHRENTRTTQAKGKISSLSVREKDVLLGLMNGHSNKMIAHDLGISPRTVEIYRAKLMEKLDARSLPEVLGIAFAAGLYQES